jgi:multiple sugar transport system permease protein
MVWYGSSSRPVARSVSEVNRPAIVRADRQSPGWRSRHIQLDRYFVQATVLPALLVMVCVFGLPLTFSLYLSFTGWAPDQALFTGRFVGLANYQDLLTDPAFTGALGKTFGYTAAAVAAQMGLGLAIALLLNVDLPGMRFFRTALIVPMMITPIVGALCWKLLLDPSHGVFNLWIGQQIVWLGRSDTALAAIWVVAVWQSTTYVTLILLAGLRSLPSEPFEAAMIDGASRRQAFWHVTLPLLRPYLLVAMLLRTIFEFRAFDNIYAMTGGGPANATMVLSMYTYLMSFVQFDFSLGAAASWLMLLMAMLMCLFFIAVIRRREAL